MSTPPSSPRPKGYSDVSRRPTWVQDKDCKSCQGCQAKFSFSKRKHHCRACGRIFCQACSDAKIILPVLDYQEPVRVCRPCFELETKRVQFHTTYKSVLQDGSIFTKLPPAGQPVSRAKLRLIKMSDDMTAFSWRDPKGGQALGSIKLVDIFTVVSGKTTPDFERRTKKFPACQCLSIITPSRTLDLVASSEKVRDQWIVAIELARVVVPAEQSRQAEKKAEDLNASATARLAAAEHQLKKAEELERMRERRRKERAEKSAALRKKYGRS